MAINSSENCRCYISNSKLCAEGSTHKAEMQAAPGLQQRLRCADGLLSTHPLSLLASINPICLEDALFSLFKKKLKPSLLLAVIHERLVMSSGVCSRLWRTLAAELPSSFSFTTCLAMADPRLCLWVAPLPYPCLSLPSPVSRQDLNHGCPEAPGSLMLHFPSL